MKAAEGQFDLLSIKKIQKQSAQSDLSDQFSCDDAETWE